MSLNFQKRSALKIVRRKIPTKPEGKYPAALQRNFVTGLALGLIPVIVVKKSRREMIELNGASRLAFKKEQNK